MDERRVLVIGGGPGGYPAAIRAAQLGFEVTLVDSGGIGGTCLHRGCIPTKYLLKAAREYRDLASRCGGAPPGPDLAGIFRRKNEIVRQLSEGTSFLLARNGVRVVLGTARFAGPRLVHVLESGESLSGIGAIVATGSESVRPLVEGIDLPGVVDSDQALEMADLPESLVIIGGGVIGVEFAQIFAMLGAKVSILESLPRILFSEDEDVSGALHKVLAASGVAIRTSVRITGVAREGGRLAVSFEGGGGSLKVGADRVLVAAGRRPRLGELGLEKIGVRTTLRGAIEVDGTLETAVPGLFAAGDVAGGLMLAHKASMEGERAAENLAGPKRGASYVAIPRVIYTTPEVACVGLREGEAGEHFGRIIVGRFPFSMNGRAALEGTQQGFVKVIAEAETGCILGAAIVGAQAGHLVGEAALAIRMEGTLEDLIETVHPHPTLAEALREAALDARGRAVHKPPRSAPGGRPNSMTEAVT